MNHSVSNTTVTQHTDQHGCVARTSIATASGGFFNLAFPKTEDVDFSAVAAALAKICRFTGHTSQFYSVAQHTLLVADNVSDEARTYALVHDAHEAFIGDWSTPLKATWLSLFPVSGQHILGMEKNLARVAHQAAGLTWPLPQAIADEVRTADIRALLTERNALGLQFGAPWPLDADYEPFEKPNGWTALTPLTAEIVLADAFCRAGLINRPIKRKRT